MRPFDYEKLYNSLKFDGRRGSLTQLEMWQVACRVMADYARGVSPYYPLRYTGSSVSFDVSASDVRVVVMIREDEFIARRVQRQWPHIGIRGLCHDLSWAVARNFDKVEIGAGWDSDEYVASVTYHELNSVGSYNVV